LGLASDASDFSVCCPGAPSTAIYTLSLHDALPISGSAGIAATGAGGAEPHDHCGARYAAAVVPGAAAAVFGSTGNPARHARIQRSEEHTSELQSRENLVCRLLLETKRAGARFKFLC